MATSTVPRAGSAAGEPFSPPAVRWQRPGWRDPRLLVGIVLVAGSVAVGSLVVSSASRTTPVLVADGTLVPGTVLAQDDVSIRHVRLAEAGDLYLPADEDLADAVVVRTVADGELVPRSALVAEGDLGLRPVAITPQGPLSGGVAAGEVVDLWFVPEPDASGSREPEPPRSLAEGLIVAEVSEETRFSVGTGATVHVLVDVEVLPDVLAALASEGSVEVVHVPGGIAAP